MSFLGELIMIWYGIKGKIRQHRGTVDFFDGGFETREDATASIQEIKRDQPNLICAEVVSYER